MTINNVNDPTQDTGEWVPVSANPELSVDIPAIETQEEGGEVWEPVENGVDSLLAPPDELAPSVVRDIREGNDLDRAVDYLKGDVSKALELTQGYSASKAKKVADLTKRLLIPESAVLSDMPKAEEIANNKDAVNDLVTINIDGRLKNPGAVSYLIDPKKMAAMRDDVQIAIEMEDIVNSANREDDSYLMDLAHGARFGAANMLEGLAKLPAGIMELAYKPQNMLAEASGVKELEAHAPKWLRDNPITDYLQTAARESMPSSKKTHLLEKLGEGDLVGGGADLLVDIASNIPNLVMMGLGSAAGFSQVATLSTMGAIEAGNTFDEALKSGKSYDMALTQALLSGTAEAVFEKFTLDQLGALLKTTGKAAIKMYGKESAKKKIKRGLLQIAKDSGIEGSSESFTEMAQAGADYITGNKDALEGVHARSLHAFLVGAATGGGMSTATQIRTEAVRSRMAEIEKSKYDLLRDKLNESSIVKDNPEATEEYLEHLEPGAKVHIEPKDVRQFLQSRKIKESKTSATDSREIDLNDLDEETRTEAEEMLLSKMQEMAHDVSMAEGQDVAIFPSETSMENIKSNMPSTFPKWHRDVGVSAEQYNRVIERGQGAPYERMREIAAYLLKHGDVNNGMESDNDYRLLVGLPDVIDGVEQVYTDDLPFDQDIETELKETLEDLGVADQLEEAEALGHTLAVSKAKWLVKYSNTDLEKSLNDKIKFTADGYNQTEIAEIKKGTKKTLEKLNKELGEVDEAEPTQFKEGRLVLMKAKGFTAEQADKSLAIFRAEAKKIAERRGISVQKHLDNIGFSINDGGEYVATKGAYLQEGHSLTETQNFKDWFGESKVVDENGAPIVAHHGGLGSAAITEFSEAYAGRTTGNNEEGAFHFTDSLEVAKDYGRQSFIRRYQDDLESLIEDGVVKKISKKNREDAYAYVEELAEEHIEKQSTYIKMENPIVIDLEGQPINVEYVEALSKFAKTGEDPTGEIGETYYDLFYREATQEEKEENREEIEEYLENNLDGGTIESAEEYMVNEAYREVVGLEPNQIDGIIIKNMIDDIGPKSRVVADQYIVFDPNNIKSVFNNGEFSSNDDNIFNQEGDEAPRASIQLDNGIALINLFKGSDLTSLLHEGGHLFVQNLEDLVRDGIATDQDIADLETLKKFAGDIKSTEGIEKVVKGFERYLAEGKAPSPALISAFNNFKDWFKRIYAELQGLPEIDNNIRGVFDRMLASENDIKEARATYERKGSLVSLLELTPRQAKAMKAKKDAANSSAEEKLLAKHLKAFIRAMKGRAGIEKTVKQNVEKFPEYIMIAAIKEVKLSEESVKEYGGDESLKTLKTQHRGTTAKEGKSLNELAVEFDYASPEDLLDALLDTPNKTEKIQTEMASFIADKEADILEGLSNQETKEGTEEIRNEENLAFIIAEHELLLQKAKMDKMQRSSAADRIDRQAFKEAAKELLSQKTVKLASRYDLYAKAEVKYANQAYNFAEKKQFKKAAQAKQKQILNHVMVQEAVKIRDVKIKAEKYYKNKSIQAKLAKTEYRYMLLATDIIERFKLNPNISPTAEVQDVNVFDEHLADTIPEWILTKITDGATWKDMQYQEFLEVDEVLKSVLHAGKDNLLSMDRDGMRTVEQVVELSKDKMTKLKDYKATDESKKKRKWLRLALQDLNMLEYIYEELDDFEMHRTDEFGPMRVMNNKGREVEGEFKDIISKTMEIAKPHWNVIEKATARIEKEHGKLFDIKGLPVIPGMELVGKYKWSVDRMTSFLLNRGNAHNSEVIDNAYGYSQDQVNIISSFFTVSELQAIQGIWDVTDTLYNPLNDTHFRMYNRKIGKVLAQEVTFKGADGDVTLEGGYYPLVFDRSLSDVAEQQQEDDLMKDLNKSVIRSSKPKDGMTNLRGKAHSLPPLLSVSVWTQHVSQTARYISHSEYLRDMMRITGDTTWKNTMQSKMGKHMYKDLRENLKHQAAPERKLGGTLNKLLEKQRGIATALILGLNVGVGLKQRLSGLSADVDLGEQWVASTMVMYFGKGSGWGGNGSKLWQEVRSKSKYIRAREGSMDREIRDTVSNLDPLIKSLNIPFINKKFTGRDAKDAVFFFIQANDRAMTGTVWMAAYRKSMSKGTNGLTQEQADAKAIIFADSIVATTQPSSLPMDLAQIQKDEGFIRLFTSFMTWTLKQQNRFKLKYRAMDAGAITKKQYLEHVIKEGLFASWGSVTISSLLLSGELPEWWEYLTSPVEYAVSGVPFARDVGSALRYNGGIGESTAFEVMNRHLRTGKTAYKVFKGDKEYYDLLWAMGYSAEAMTGVPALKVVKNMKNTHDILTGKKQAENRKKRRNKKRK